MLILPLPRGFCNNRAVTFVGMPTESKRGFGKVAQPRQTALQVLDVNLQLHGWLSKRFLSWIFWMLQAAVRRQAWSWITLLVLLDGALRHYGHLIVNLAPSPDYIRASMIRFQVPRLLCSSFIAEFIIALESVAHWLRLRTRKTTAM